MSPGPPPVSPQGPNGGGRTARTVIGSVLGIFGVLVLAGGGLLAGHAYSNSQQTIANPSYGLDLWRDEPVDRIYPETIGGRDNRLGDLINPKHAKWHRLGISPDTSCEKGLTGETLKAANRLGCKAVLRATYVDPTAKTLATVAIIVLPTGESKKAELAEFFEDQEGHEGAVKPLPVAGTPAAGWNRERRSGAGLKAAYGEHLPYAVAATTGAVDSKVVAGDLPGDWGSGELGVMTDRGSWHDTARDVVDTFEAQITDLQLEGAK
jgi:hypothetical protein